jgi:hypothetical protein
MPRSIEPSTALAPIGPERQAQLQAQIVMPESIQQFAIEMFAVALLRRRTG